MDVCTLILWTNLPFVLPQLLSNWSLNNCRRVHLLLIKATEMLCSLIRMQLNCRRSRSPEVECSFRNGWGQSWGLQPWSLGRMEKPNWTLCLLIPACNVVELEDC